MEGEITIFMTLEKPEEKYHITGKGLTPEKREILDSVLKAKKTEVARPIEGELEKTPEQLKMIDLANKYINEELQEAGLKKKFNLSSDRIHFLPADAYEREFPEKSKIALAFNQIVHDEIFIDLSEFADKKKLYDTILHEGIHLASAEKYISAGEGKDWTFRLSRSGYQNIGESERHEHEHFRGLNEMIVTKVSADINKKHQEELIKEFNFSKKEGENLGAYGYYTKILDLAIQGIAERNKESEQDVWTRFKKGLFTGEMMCLRDIERTFGKGSLRVIASLYSATKQEIDIEKTYNAIVDYLETNDEEKRDKIAEEILIDREYKKYKKQ